MLGVSRNMTAERQPKKIPLWKAVGCGVLLAVILLQFRLLSFTLIAIFGSLIACLAPCRSLVFTIPAALVVALSLFLPFDIALGNYHFGSRRGTSSGGPHFVRFVVGMPMHTRLIERYGEYVSAGCAWPAAFPPRWILVWN
jgi:hypothetical protein